MICTVIFCLVFTAPAKWRIELRAKIGQYRNRCFVYHNVCYTTCFVNKWQILICSWTFYFSFVWFTIIKPLGLKSFKLLNNRKQAMFFLFFFLFCFLLFNVSNFIKWLEVLLYISYFLETVVSHNYIMCCRIPFSIDSDVLVTLLHLRSKSKYIPFFKAVIQCRYERGDDHVHVMIGRPNKDMIRCEECQCFRSGYMTCCG